MHLQVRLHNRFGLARNLLARQPNTYSALAALRGANAQPTSISPCMSSVLNVALFTDSSNVKHPVAQLARWIDDQAHMTCTLIVVQPTQARTSSASASVQRTKRQPVRALLWKLMLAIERTRVRRSNFKEQLGRLVCLDHEPPSGGIFRFKSVEGETKTALAQRVRSGLGHSAPHLIVQLGMALPVRELADCAQQGVLELVRGSGHLIGDGSSGFWEVLTQSAKTVFAVKHVPPSGAPMVTVAHGYLATQTAFLMNQFALVVQLQQVLRELLLHRLRYGDFSRKFLDVVVEPVRRSRPTASQLMLYGMAVARRAVRLRVRVMLQSKQKWQVHYKREDWSTLTLDGGHAIPNPPGVYFADPFLRQTPDGLFCFVEEFRESSQRGVISALRLDVEGPVYLGHVLDEPFHLSFPFMFEFDGELFMCPETNEAHQIRLYKCKAFPLQWELHSVAMDNVCAVDTLIFAEHDKWWMLTGIVPQGDTNRYPEMHLFCADDPICGEWLPHVCNPIKVDPEFARNAGLLSRDGKLFRVSQVCGFSAYGESINVCEIKKLSLLSYDEVLTARINANSKPGNTGLHHIDHAGGVTVWDEKEWSQVFSPRVAHDKKPKYDQGCALLHRST